GGLYLGRPGPRHALRLQAGAGTRAQGAELERNGGSLQLLGDTEKNYTSGGQREGNLRSAETAMFSSSAIQEPQASTSLEPLPVQLPASFTYSYSWPLSPFSAGPSLSPPAATVTAPHPPQMPPYWGACDTSLWSGAGYQGIDPQELQRDRRDYEPHHQRTPVFRRPGDWDCPWCKAVNFSWREICFRCGRAIWLQSPQ
uniref:RanBP2-type domain-containing protein n=1 Tax=Prolemur simus TaxID=1328070 RepID=A0A8C8Z871_PROSS